MTEQWYREATNSEIIELAYVSLAVVPVEGVVGYAVLSTPLIDGSYQITMIADKPLDSLTMHGDVMLVGIEGGDHE